MFHLFRTENNVAKTDNVKTDVLLNDLGLGKETQFAYPWYPDPNPMPDASLCETAQKLSDEEKNAKFPDKGASSSFFSETLPAKDCNEFVFTRM